MSTTDGTNMDENKTHAAVADNADVSLELLKKKNSLELFCLLLLLLKVKKNILLIFGCVATKFGQ